ncbi:unnamed protein product [Rotaria sordida]|uniref:Uncharacterized protein n=1 Tax=Rotaria sordida TaxID=392033 RepID=A0A816C7U8_9BILA|nr:unnamed protein product [Rotaria sordida]CAF1380915.1 unnamed protein product [Rotaria sordida]CAF1401393.1 unnamed protein product [Rotaria sordida]CAF1618430.1 unnamed protein product [Rotaria sordida]CAF3928922.1 unnamed protein product [Rotaria sordida]
MKELQQTSFPRPSVDGRLFLEQLLQSLKNSETDEDRRTNAELAVAFGLSEATLMSLSNIDPQKTSLRVFNALFPTNKAKEYLKNVTHVITEYPNLLNDIYVFARRCSPDCVYTMAMLKDAIGNSIRCARHNVKKANTQHIAAAAVLQLQMNHGNNDINNI